VFLFFVKQSRKGFAWAILLSLHLKSNLPQRSPMKKITKLSIAFALLITIGILIISTYFKSKKTDQVLNTELFIVSQVDSKNKIGESKFSPVLIYKSNPQGNEGNFIGSGSFFVGKSGQQVITAEHLLYKEQGIVHFGFRKLRPLEIDVTHGIASIVATGSVLSLNKKTHPDVVLLRVGDLTPVQCYSEYNIGMSGLTGSTVEKYEKPISVRSLVSGQKFNIFGYIDDALKENNDGSRYLILDKFSVSGESGTGFVDDEDCLYVLKGSMTLDEENALKVQKLFGSNTSRFSLLYGPLQIR
jgi:hypothetical protein